jgi:thiol-disulfide isomerase/thioredoxin
MFRASAWLVPSAIVASLLAGLLVVASGCGSPAPATTAETKKFRPVDAAEAAAPAAVATDDAAKERVAFVSGSQAPSDDPQRAASASGAIKSADAPATRDAAAKNAPAASQGNIDADENAENAAAEKQLTPELRSVLEDIDRLARQQPKGNTQQERLESVLMVQKQRLELANKALALKPPAPYRRQLVRAIAEIYQVNVQLQIPGAANQLAEFGKRLAADPDPQVARIGRHTEFTANISRIASQPLENGQQIVAEAKKLLAAEKGNVSEDTEQLVGSAADMLTTAGMTMDSVTLIEALAEALKATPNRAENAARYSTIAKLIRTDLSSLLEDVIREKPAAEQKLVAAVKGLLADVPPTGSLFQSTRQVAGVLEATGHYKAAQDCFEMIGAAFKDSSDSQLASSVAQMAEKAQRRMSLVGQPLAVEGVTPDGQPFDWSPYVGKVVLVDFWATWCGPCIEELPNVRQNFEQFHGKGFDVIGVSIDHEISNLKQFLTLQDVPWATVTTPEVIEGKVSREQAFELPMPAKCGVDAIPFLVLIGKDGKVDSIHVRGPKLKARLTELLGEPVTTEVPSDPTQPAARPADAKPAAAKPADAKPADAKPAAGQAPEGKQSRSGFQAIRAASPIAALVAQAIFTAPADASADQQDNKDNADAANPYLAKPGLTPSELVAYIQKMLDKPAIIQAREGFAEAIAQACDRVLAAQDSTASEKRLAAETKLAVLHRAAMDGNKAADEQLGKFVETLKDDSRPSIASEVKFLRLERRVLDAPDLPLEQIPALLKDVEQFAKNEKLTGQHLRLASASVAAINRLEDGDEREQWFGTLGAAFAESSDRELSRYGQKLARTANAGHSDLIGKPLALSGKLFKGGPLHWDSYRGKVVLVDFWATWCGPCRAAMPHVREFYEQHREAGLEVLGVSLDDDQEALADYLKENRLPWPTLAGDATQELAEKYKVQAIPTMMLVDRAGKVVGVAHSLDDLATKAEKLLSAKSK